MLPSSAEVISNFARRWQEASEFLYSDPPKHKAILEELYRDEITRRCRLAYYVGTDVERQNKTLEYISRREAIVDWMVDWGWTLDPRNAAIGLPTIIPMIPFLRQIEMIEWVYNLYLQQSGGMVEKSREMGATWIFSFIMVREWRWEYGFRAGVGSRKLSLVDDKENPKAVFHKIRTIIDTMPSWWLPGYSSKKNDKIANINNPINGSTISGEGGDDIGRGDRTSMYLLDEAAYLEHPHKADSALSRTTQSQFDVSSANGPNYYYQKRISGRVPVFTYNWRDDPRKNQEWHDKETARLGPVIAAQEIDIDYFSSVENIFIPAEYVRAAIDIDLPDYGICSAGLDVAAGGRAKSSLAIKRGCRVTLQQYSFKNGVDLTYKVIEECNNAGVDCLNYDPIGVGHSVHSAIERSPVDMGFEYFPMLAGGSPSEKFYEEFGRSAKDLFYNAKAEWYYNLYILFKNTWEFKEHGIQHSADEMISIPNDGDLIQQLSAPKKLWTTTGKMQVESKESLATREIHMLDAAESVVLANISKDSTFQRVWPTYKHHHYRDVNINFKQIDAAMSKMYIVLVYEKNTGIYGNAFFWGRKSRALRVYAEFVHPDPIVEILANDIREKAMVPLESPHAFNARISKILGSEEMFLGKSDWAYIMRSKGRIRMHKSDKHDEAASVATVRSMMARNQIIVDRSLNQTNMQYKNWRIIGGKPEEGYPHCRALCIAVSELRESRELDTGEDRIYEKPYSRKNRLLRERIKQAGSPYKALAVHKITATKSEYDYLLK